MAGNFSERNLNPFGNLYVTFTNDAKICDNGVVTYGLIDDNIINGLNIDIRTGNIELNMGHYGMLNIKKKLLTYVLKKLKIPGSECVSRKTDFLSNYNNYAGTTSSVLENNDSTDASLDTLIENIMMHHNSIINKMFKDFQENEIALYDKLNIKIIKLNRCKQSVDPTYKKEKEVQPENRVIVSDESFKKILKENILSWQSKVCEIILSNIY